VSFVQQTELFSRPEEVTEFFLEELRENANLLGIEFVGGYGERILPSYPAVVVNAGTLDKELHGTHTYLITIRALVYVYHAQMTITHASRSLADLQLASTVVDFLERDLTLGDRIINGFVVSEVPGATQVNARKSDVVVSTRLTWEGISERRF
jgi:hypothetical protein